MTGTAPKRAYSRRLHSNLVRIPLSNNSELINKWEFELRVTSYELRSKKFRGHSPASMELFDVQWRAVRLAELSLRTSHLALRTFVGTTNINLVSFESSHVTVVHA